MCKVSKEGNYHYLHFNTKNQRTSLNKKIQIRSHSVLILLIVMIFSRKKISLDDPSENGYFNMVLHEDNHFSAVNPHLSE